MLTFVFYQGTVNEQLHVHSAEFRYSSDMCRDERPFTCEVCNRTFTQKWTLKRHQRIHSGERPYVCEVCNKGFSNQSHLKTHHRIHSGERPYSCDVCNKAFSDKSGLRQHVNKHT